MESRRPSVLFTLTRPVDAVHMNFDEALLAHAEWKLRLNLYIHGEGSLDAKVVAEDCHCKLGKWLYAEGRKFQSEVEYEDLRRVHAEFHRHAAQVVEAVDRGDREGARAMLAPGSAYADASTAVFVAIGAIKARVAEKTDLIMQCVPSGILVIDATLLVQSGYSQQCHTLLGARHVTGAHLCDLLRLRGRDFEQVELALQQVFEDVLPADVTLAMLPPRVTVGARVLSMRASALRSTGDEIDYVLFTFEDVSHLAAMEQELTHARSLLRIARSRDAFLRFSIDTRAALEARLECLEDEIGLRRDIHTLKGNAGLFDLHSVVDAAQQVEDLTAIGADDVRGLLAAFDGALREIDDQLGRSTIGHAQVFEIDQDALAPYERIDRDGDTTARARALRSLVQRLHLKPVRALLGPVEDRVTSLAARLDKDVVCEVSGADTLIDAERAAPVFQALAHVYRNAIDHGIEACDERLARGKPERGQLCMQVRRDRAWLRVTVRDDGRGIDVERLARKAVTLGLTTADAVSAMSHDERLQLVFLDGLSTADRASEISGRGVGMSALRAAVEALRGTITLRSRPGEGTTIELAFPDAGHDLIESLVPRRAMTGLSVAP